jgi:HEPN domain-containing protein
MAKAGSDLLCIKNNLAAQEIPWEAIVFHAQQAAEKALKGFLVGRGVKVTHTHDLGRLLDDCIAVGGALSQFSDDCDSLTAYAVQFRYPGDLPDVNRADGEAAVAAAERIFNAVAPLIDVSG